jgi:hypothetical protein
MTTLAAILVLAAGLRWFAFRSVKKYSPADEAVYAEQVRWLNTPGRKGFRAFVDVYLATPRVHDFPSPLRWGYLFLAAGWCRAYRESDERALAIFSSFCGLGVVVMSWVLARQLVGATAAAWCAALVACSALQLIVGRRALSDTPAALAAITYLAAAIWYAQAPTTLTASAVLLLGALAITVKETALVFVLPVGLVLAVATHGLRPDMLLAVVLGPVLLWIALSMLVVGGRRRLVALIRNMVAQKNGPYVAAYQSGVWSRSIVDLALVVPLTLVAAVAGATLLLQRGSLAVPTALVAAVLLAGLAPLKNVRMQLVAEVLVCVAAGVALAELGIFSGLLVCASGVWMGHKMVNVYDPVTLNLVRALNMGGGLR